MSGLGWFKTGKKASPSFSSSEPYRSSVDLEDFDADEGLAIGDEAFGADSIADGDSLADSVESGLSPIPQGSHHVDLLLPSQQVKKTMKLLKYSCKPDATEAMVLEAAMTVQKLANTTYSVKSDLGERGVCEALIMMLEKHKSNAEISLEILKAMHPMLLSDDQNKVRLAKLGGCKLTVELMLNHNDESALLETCCKLIVEFGNGKFARILEEDYRKQEERRELKSRSMKRRALTPGRIAAMSPAAAASAMKALEEADLRDQQDKEEKEAQLAESKTEETKRDRGSSFHRAESKKVHIAEQDAIWDNRLELCRVGVCEALTTLLHGLVKMPHSATMPQLSFTGRTLQAIFEDEDVAVAACNAIASLAANSTCARVFAKDGQISRSLCTLLLHAEHWQLVTASTWAMLNLCADSRSGNRERMGQAHAVEHLCKILADLTVRHADLEHIAGFDRLLEYSLWALLNTLINTPSNQSRVRVLEREELFEQLFHSPWVKPSAKDKLRQIVKLVTGQNAVAETK